MISDIAVNRAKVMQKLQNGDHQLLERPVTGVHTNNGWNGAIRDTASLADPHDS